MLDRMTIEDGVERFLLRLWEYEVSVYVAQAKAAGAAINGGNVAELSGAARAEIARLAKTAKNKTLPGIRREIADLVKADIDEQLELYRQGYRAGIILNAPAIPLAVQAANIRTIMAVNEFVESTIERISRYAGDKVGDVIRMAVEDKLKGGVTTDQLAKAAAALIREEGIRITMPSGRNVHDIYAYARRNVTSAMLFNSAEQQKEIFHSMDAKPGKKGVATSSHWGARPEHAEWQGQVFASWEEFERVTKYGDITGICGINCRHSFYPFLFGLSEQRYFPMPEEENDRRYQARQKQKRMESDIRKMAASDEIRKAMGLPPEHTAKLKQKRKAARAWKTYQEDLARSYESAA